MCFGIMYLVIKYVRKIILAPVSHACRELRQQLQRSLLTSKCKRIFFNKFKCDLEVELLTGFNLKLLDI